MDPVELRLKNAMGPGDRAFGGQPVPSCVLRECLQRASATRNAMRRACLRRRGQAAAAASASP